MEEIIYVLTKYRELIQGNLEKKKALYEEMGWEIADKELIEILALKRKDVETIASRGYTNGLEDLVIQKKKKKAEYMNELRKRMELLDGEWEIIQRVWVCLQSLPVDQYEILKKMYLEKEKWNVIEKQMDISHGCLVKRRKTALLNLQKMYNAPYSNLQLAERKLYVKLQDNNNRKIKLTDQILS